MPTRREDVSVPVLGPLTGHGASAGRILRALPGWFGIESAVLDYVRAADELPTLVALSPGPAGAEQEPSSNRVIGFVTPRRTSEDALELHVVGVLPDWHRRGIPAARDPAPGLGAGEPLPAPGPAALIRPRRRTARERAGTGRKRPPSRPLAAPQAPVASSSASGVGAVYARVASSLSS
jgi:hypothetical protein